MFIKNPKGYYEFSEFKKFSGLIHGFSTRRFGDCRVNPEKFLKVLGLEKKDLVLGEQVHREKIKVIRLAERGKIISGVDGLLTQEIGLVLGVRAADCLPILYWEPEGKILGVAHAGWRGIIAKLPQKMIDQMIRIGGLPENILVAIGPHICQKCYEVDKQRINRFISEFGKLRGMVKKGKYLDLFIPVWFQLIHSGVRKENIFHSGRCTSCENEDFFSYRKNKNSGYGEMLSVISLVV